MKNVAYGLRCSSYTLKHFSIMKTNDSKQVAAFEKLLGNCNALGAMYNPSKASVKITALNAMLTQAQQLTQAVNNAKNARLVAINVRQDSFNALPKLATRIVGALTATDASASLIADVRSMSRKFRPQQKSKGKNSNATPQAENPAPADASRGPLSHLDYESQIVNLSNVIDLLKTEPSYKPNEADLQIAGLNTLLTSLNNKHKAVSAAQLAVKNAQMARDKVLFDANTGIYGTSKVVKEYICSVLGSQHSTYQEVKSIRFRNR
jgi:hypothetical protein